jgi:CBS domain-containing protein
MLRLRMQQDSYLRGVPMHNHVRPEQLDPGQRRLLLRSLRQAGTLQQQLSLAFLRGQRL